MKIILLKWLPASGKSTRAKQYFKDNPWTVRLNKDLAREQFHFSKYSKSNERYVLTMRDESLQRALILWHDVIIDDTNFNPAHLEQLKTTIKLINREDVVEIEEKFFDAWLETCLRRNSRRHKSVPEYAIRNMYVQAIENWYEFKEVLDYEYHTDTLKPKAIIFDVDWTLAEMNWRWPYEYDKVHTDILKKPTADILRLYQELWHSIIIFTWREDTQDCWVNTLKWLEYHNIIPDHFEIRKEWDMRCDSIVKREMFDKYCDDYNIESVFDDRDRVVAMWRNIWLQCFQVNYWNF